MGRAFDIYLLQMPIPHVPLDVLMAPFYACVPNPFFVVDDGKSVAPDVMMIRVPALGFVVGSGVLASLLVYGTRAAGLGMVAAIPITVHWVLFVCHAFPYKTEKLFDTAGQLGFQLMSL